MSHWFVLNESRCFHCVSGEAVLRHGPYVSVISVTFSEFVRFIHTNMNSASGVSYPLLFSLIYSAQNFWFDFSNTGHFRTNTCDFQSDEGGWCR